MGKIGFLFSKLCFIFFLNRIPSIAFKTNGNETDRFFPQSSQQFEKSDLTATLHNVLFQLIFVSFLGRTSIKYKKSDEILILFQTLVSYFIQKSLNPNKPVSVPHKPPHIQPVSSVLFKNLNIFPWQFKYSVDKIETHQLFQLAHIFHIELIVRRKLKLIEF
jgi:hypothetical protein